MKFEHSNEMPPDYERMKNEILAEFPKEKITGVDTKTVEDFIIGQGLPLKEYAVLSEEDLPKIRDIIGDSNFFHGMLEGEKFAGSYIPELQMAFVYRRGIVPLATETTGNIFLEGLLVHELGGHATSGYNDFVTTDKKHFDVPRLGLCITNHQKNNEGTMEGLMLEEGWADMQYAEYVKTSRPEKKDSLVRELGADMEKLIPFTIPEVGTIEVPVKYIYLDEEYSPNVRATSLAGYALELLCKKNPKIKPLLFEARNSVQALRDLAKEIDAIRPGLYEELQSGEYSIKSFGKKLKEVMDVCG